MVDVGGKRTRRDSRTGLVTAHVTRVTSDFQSLPKTAREPVTEVFSNHDASRCVDRSSLLSRQSFCNIPPQYLLLFQLKSIRDESLEDLCRQNLTADFLRTLGQRSKINRDAIPLNIWLGGAQILTMVPVSAQIHQKFHSCGGIINIETSSFISRSISGLR